MLNEQICRIAENFFNLLDLDKKLNLRYIMSIKCGHIARYR